MFILLNTILLFPIGASLAYVDFRRGPHPFPSSTQTVLFNDHDQFAKSHRPLHIAIYSSFGLADLFTLSLVYQLLSCTAIGYQCRLRPIQFQLVDPDFYAVSQKNRTPVTFRNNFAKTARLFTVWAENDR